MLRTIIIDDEKNAREAIARIAKLHCENVSIIASADDVESGITAIKKHDPDLVLLDIKMPGGPGFDLLKKIDDINFFTIFITAFNEYAVKAFKFSAIDYLLKPIDFDRFYKAVTKIISLKDPHVEHQSNTDSLPKTDKLFIKADNKILKVSFQDIIVINGDGPYVKIITNDERKIMSLQSMSKLIQLLPANFYRVHRSHIVNINCIDSIEGNTITLGEERVVISKSNRDAFFKMINSSS